jgi:hypothetical protein
VLSKPTGSEAKRLIPCSSGWYVSKIFPSTITLTRPVLGIASLSFIISSSGITPTPVNGDFFNSFQLGIELILILYDKTFLKN